MNETVEKRAELPGSRLLVLLGVLVILVGLGSGCAAEKGVTGSDQPPRPPGTQEDAFFRARVFFGTDRAHSDSAPGGFGPERGEGSLTYGWVEVSIPDSHEIGQIEAPAWWNLWDRENPTKYVLLLSTSTFEDRQAFVADLRDQLGEVGRDDVLLFVHGYNNSFEEAGQRTAQLAYDLRFPGVPMFFSWPSRDDAAAYPSDEATIQWSAPHLATFLRDVLTSSGARYVHVIAHSMGNRAFLEVLHELDPSSLPAGSAELRQIILAAPDIDVGVFEQLSAQFHGKARRITLYSSARDRAILASKTFHDAPRAGGTVVVVDGIDTVDASLVETGFLGHSYFGDSIVDDVFGIIRNEAPPEARFGLVQRSLPSKPDSRYWEVRPEP